MPRYILIDNHSGYIFGDTADMPLNHEIDGVPVRDLTLTPEIAARWLDEAVQGYYGYNYREVYHLSYGETGYQVYRADIDGGDVVPIAHDGSDPDAIAAVERDCPFVAHIRRGFPLD